LGTSIFRNQCDTCLDRPAVGMNRLTIDRYRSTVGATPAKDRLRNLGPTGPEQSGQPDNFTGIDGEGNWSPPFSTAEAINLQYGLVGSLVVAFLPLEGDASSCS
jgi:hypothetical protein